MLETARGFSYDVFNDAKGTECSIQNSSASGSYIWFGLRRIEPVIEIPDGLKPVTCLHLKSGTEINLELCEGDIVWNNRMHLSQINASEIIALFEVFRNNGFFEKLVRKDRHNVEWSIQITGDYLEIGCDNPDPQICIDGWKELILPENAIVVTHMFLSVKEIDMLLPLLKTFIETGSISG